MPHLHLESQGSESLNTYITDMLSRGLIVPSTSSVVSPVLLVPKADGTLRPCVDFKRLNAVTEPDHYPMPLMPDIVQMITGSVIFSKLDLKDAFNQIPVKKEHQKFTAFKCPRGVFEYKVMPFGLRNAPAVFQRMIDTVLGMLVGVCCVAYMDDILVFSPSREQHTKDFVKVLSALSRHNLKLKPSKCEFYKDQVSFLGNLILKDGHAVCPDKLRAIKEWGVPRTTTKLRSFLGSINFLRRFCKDISAVAAPLTALFGDAPFTWDTAQ